MSLYLCEKRIKGVFSSSSSIWARVCSVLFWHDATSCQKGALLTQASQLDSAQKTRVVRYQQNHVHTRHEIKLERRWWVMVKDSDGSTMILTVLNLPPGGAIPLLFPCAWNRRTRPTAGCASSTLPGPLTGERSPPFNQFFIFILRSFLPPLLSFSRFAFNSISSLSSGCSSYFHMLPLFPVSWHLSFWSNRFFLLL